MTDLFIASRRVEHDGSRRVIAAGSFNADALRINGSLESAELAAKLIAGRLKRELAAAQDKSAATGGEAA